MPEQLFYSCSLLLAPIRAFGNGAGVQVRALSVCTSNAPEFARVSRRIALHLPLSAHPSEPSTRTRRSQVSRPPTLVVRQEPQLFRLAFLAGLLPFERAPDRPRSRLCRRESRM